MLPPIGAGMGIAPPASGTTTHVLCDGVVVGRIMKVAAVLVGMFWMWTLAYDVGSLAAARLRADARGRDGGVREKLAAGIAPAALETTKEDGLVQ